MDETSQERPDEGPTLKLNKRFKQTSLNKKFGNTRQRIYGLTGLEKINSIAFLEVNLISRKTPVRGESLSAFQKLKIT